MPNRFAVRDMGTSMRFSAFGHQVVSASVITLASTMTYAMWFKKAGSGTGGVPRLFEVNGSSAMAVGNAGAGSIPPGNVAFGAWLNTGVKLDNGVWYHLVGVQNGTSNLLYVNGTPAFSGNNGASPSGSAVIKIGNNAGDTISGFLDDFCVWNTVLTPSQINNLCFGGDVPTTNLTLRYKFDEGSGTTATDSSLSFNNGTITSASYSTDVFIKPRVAA